MSAPAWTTLKVSIVLEMPDGTRSITEPQEALSLQCDCGTIVRPAPGNWCPGCGAVVVEVRRADGA